MRHVRSNCPRKTTTGAGRGLIGGAAFCLDLTLAMVASLLVLTLVGASVGPDQETTAAVFIVTGVLYFGVVGGRFGTAGARLVAASEAHAAASRTDAA